MGAFLRLGSSKTGRECSKERTRKRERVQEKENWVDMNVMRNVEPPIQDGSVY